MGESGCFLPLEDRLAKAGLGEAEFLPNVYTYGMYSQHKWGIPASLNTTAIYFNKQVAREAGLDPDKPPTTIAELDEWSRRMTGRDGNGGLTRIGFVPNRLTVWMANFGGEVFDTDSKSFTLDQRENIESLEWMKSLYDQVGIDTYRRFAAGFGKTDSPQNPFFVGKIGLRKARPVVPAVHPRVRATDGVRPLPLPLEGGRRGNGARGGELLGDPRWDEAPGRGVGIPALADGAGAVRALLRAAAEHPAAAGLARAACLQGSAEGPGL